MVVDLSNIVNKNEKIAVAVSGGSDSMALLHFLSANAPKYGYSIAAINVEHGIRGESSEKDTEFVKNYCLSHGIEFIPYSVNALSRAKQSGLTVEEAARQLRYECFFDAVARGKCDKIATAHHLRDNVESILLNLFRGTGLKGVAGINANFSDKIIRPFLDVPKEEITEYVKIYDIPYVTDETNLSDDYTRNYIRLNVLPKIKEIFPEAERSIARFSKIAKAEDEYLDGLASGILTFNGETAEIVVPSDKVLFSRAAIIALKKSGIEKDWAQVHINDLYSLSQKQNGNKINLPKNLIAVKEYGKVVIYRESKETAAETPYRTGKTVFGDKVLIAEEQPLKNISGRSFCALNLKNGFYADENKIPKTAVYRTINQGDVFTKFGGGTKKLCDYFTDKKIPQRLRASIPLLCDGNYVLVIFGVAVSDSVKVESNTKKLIKFTYEDK